MIALLAVLAALSALTMWCCCVAAGEADRRMEELWRQREEDRCLSWYVSRSRWVCTIGTGR